MAFTLVTVTGSFKDEHENPLQGTFTFTLTQPIANSGTVLPVAPITVALDASGGLSVKLPANDDVATVPAGSWYGVTEQLQNAIPRDYFIQVSQAVNPVDLGTLMPTTAQWQ